MTQAKRAILLVLDSFGVGASADAELFGDVGANTLGHIAEHCAAGRCEQGRSGPLHLPELQRLGLFAAAEASAGPADYWPEGEDMVGAYGFAKELSTGKDTSSGHWEMAGVPVFFDWSYFLDKTNSFPSALLEQLIAKGSLAGVLGNCHASGTEIIARLGQEHIRTGQPIVYTSADSVLQIAAHEETFGLERLLALCESAREILDSNESLNVGRVIARPFLGDGPDDFYRTNNRRDYSVLPPAPTLLDKLEASGTEVVSVGKISDIFAHQGISTRYKASGIDGLFDATLEALSASVSDSLVFTNFVDFDSSYGHRRDVCGYARALEAFDARLPELLRAMGENDVLILSADHGCDPSWPGSDHTREHVPVLLFGHKVTPGFIGGRETFADIGQSLAHFFNIDSLDHGESFLKLNS